MAFIKVGKKGKIINLWQKLNVLNRKSEFHKKIKTNIHQAGFENQNHHKYSPEHCLLAQDQVDHDY